MLPRFRTAVISPPQSILLQGPKELPVHRISLFSPDWQVFLPHGNCKRNEMEALPLVLTFNFLLMSRSPSLVILPCLGLEFYLFR